MSARPGLLAALGSSFAAGPTIEPVADAAAMRSARNYPHLLAAALDADLADLTVSGATTANILHTPQQTTSGAVFAPQLDGLPSGADLVTITAGGNDLRFLGSMVYAAWSRHAPDDPVTRMLGEDFPTGPLDVTDDDIQRAAAGLASIVAAVRGRAAGARVLLVEYLTIVSDRTPAGDGQTFGVPELAVIRRIQDGLARAYRLAAARSGAELVDVAGISAGHGLGDPDPWVSGFRTDPATTGGSFHPNAAGMQAVADHLFRLVG